MGAKQQMYLDFLKREGYFPEVDRDGDITFKREGGLFLLFTEEEDPAYFRLVYPGFWSIDSEEERQRALKAAVEIGREIKVVKIYLTEKNTWAAVEQFFDPIEDFQKVFGRLIRTLRGGVTRFGEKMRGE